jgi:predicted MFS family arabinose efflux permease
MTTVQKAKTWYATCWPLVAATFAVGTDAWVVAGFLPRMAHDVDTSVAAAGRSVTVFALAYAAGAPCLAAATARMRRRTVLVVALLALAGANLATAAAQDIGELLAARVGAGLAASLVTPTAGALAATAVGEARRGRVLALVVSGLTLATAFGVPFGTAASALTGWRDVLLLVALLCAAAAIAVQLVAPDAPGSPSTALGQRFASLGNRAVRHTLALTTVGMAAAYCGYAFVGPITGLSGARLTLALGAYGLGALAGSVGSGQLTDRIGPTATLAFAYAVLAPATLLVAWRGPLPAVAGAALLWGAASWTQTPPQQKRLLGQRPSDATMVIGLNASALYLGIALGTSIGSVLIGVGRVTVVAAGAALAIVAAIVNAAVGRRDEARQWRVYATPEILTQPGYVSLAAADAPVREVFPGIRLRPLWTGPTGAHANVLEMDPGTRWPKRDIHEPGPEEVYVLAGVFNDGARDYPAGTFLHAPAGTWHVPATREGCTLFLFYPEG